MRSETPLPETNGKQLQFPTPLPRHEQKPIAPPSPSSGYIIAVG